MKNRILFLTFIEHSNFIGKAETLIGTSAFMVIFAFA